MSVERDLTRARTLAKRGEIDAARKVYLDVLQRFPGNRRAEEALAALRGTRGLAVGPMSAASIEAELQALTSCYAQGRYSEVIEQGRQLRARHSGRAEVANLMGAAHAMLGQLEAALEQYAAAARACPDYAEAHHNAANVLKALGRQSEAIASYRKAIAARPEYGEAHRNLGTLKTYAADDPDLGELRRLAGREGLAARDRMHLGFALAKALDDAGATAPAFAELAAANRLRKAELGYDSSADRKLFAGIEALFSEAAFAQCLPSRSPPTLAPRPIFILGMPRSGTTLVEQILASHSAVHGGGEMGTLNALAGRAMSRLPSSSGGAAGLSAAIDEIRSGYNAALSRLPTGRPVVTDKMPSNFRWIGFIRLALPEATIVHVTREPVATCWSIYKTYFATSGNGYAYDLVDVAEYYKLYRRLMDFWRRRFPGAIHELDYEALTRDQASETRKLVAHCGLEWEDACLSFHETSRPVETASAAQVRRALYKGSSEAWRKFERELAPLVEALSASASSKP